MKVSIITVCYNSQSTIEDCIKSVINQSYKNLEYIIIDGKSNDRTIEIIKKYQNQIYKIISEPDHGIYDAMNKGIINSSGDLIGFINSDDLYYSKNVLERVVSEFKKNPILDCLYSDLIYINKYNSKKVLRYWKSSQFKKKSFAYGWSPPHNTFFVKKNIYETYGCFDLSYEIASDIELMMRFLEKHNISSKYISEIWVKMRIGGKTNESIKNIFQQNREVIRALKRYNIHKNTFLFLFSKLLSRSIQYLKAFFIND